MCYIVKLMRFHGDTLRAHSWWSSAAGQCPLDHHLSLFSAIEITMDAQQPTAQTAQPSTKPSPRSRSRPTRQPAQGMELLWRDLHGVIVGLSDFSHVLIIDGRVIRLSQTQYRLIRALINRYMFPIRTEELVRQAFHCVYSPLDDHRLNQQIYRIRVKLEWSGLRIWPVDHYGYVLLVDTQRP
jgi:hypothetical protein